MEVSWTLTKSACQENRSGMRRFAQLICPSILSHKMSAYSLHRRCTNTTLAETAEYRSLQRVEARELGSFACAWRLGLDVIGSKGKAYQL
jgi:hypothetical protein